MIVCGVELDDIDPSDDGLTSVTGVIVIATGFNAEGAPRWGWSKNGLDDPTVVGLVDLVHAELVRRTLE